MSYATPCKYADIGKRTQDLFVKNFAFGAIKFNLKSASMFGSGFSIEGYSELEGGKVMGFGEFKNTFPGTNAHMTSKWFSDNTLSSEVHFHDKLFPGTRLGLLTRFDPKGGNMAGGIQLEYKNEFMLGMMEMSLTGEGKPMASNSFVFTSDGWLAGMHCYMDPQSFKVDKPQFTGGYETSTYSAFVLLNEKNQLLGSLYQKVNSSMETGILVHFPYGSNSKGTNFQYAVNYELDSSHRLQAKLNTFGQVGVSVSKNFGSGINISLCANLDGKNIKGGSHKFGMAIEMDL